MENINLCEQYILQLSGQIRIKAKLINVQYGPSFRIFVFDVSRQIRKKDISALEAEIEKVFEVPAVRITCILQDKKITVEFPNKNRNTVYFRDMIPDLLESGCKIPMVLGKTVSGKPVVIDLAKEPHLLISGMSGSGKSACIKSLICSLLYTKKTDEVKIVIVDQKSDTTSFLNGNSHLYVPCIDKIDTALETLESVYAEMERRMDMFWQNDVKGIVQYNDMIKERGMDCEKLPYIVFIIDEYADLELSETDRFESSVKRIAPIGRFCGIHLVLATKYPSSKIVTLSIKSNLPTVIALYVNDSLKSRVLIGQNGAEKLLGCGDMLYCAESSNPVRIQGAFIGDMEEIVKTSGGVNNDSC